MPPKSSTSAKIIIEELSEATSDSKIIESLAEALSPLIALSIDECLTKRLSVFTAQLDDVTRSNAALVSRLEELKQENAAQTALTT
jgi:hypothetical protein